MFHPRTFILFLLVPSIVLAKTIAEQHEWGVPSRHFFIYKKHTTVTFTGTFLCNLFNTTYCVTGAYKEYDYIIEDNHIKKLPLYCTNENILAHNSTMVYEDGDGLFDFWYEPVLELFHNCSQNGMVHQILHFIPQFSINNEFFEHNYELDITENGSLKPFKEDSFFKFYHEAFVREKRWDRAVIDWIYNNGTIGESEIPYNSFYMNNTLEEDMYDEILSFFEN